jgi:hypothetical protein
MLKTLTTAMVLVLSASTLMAAIPAMDNGKHMQPQFQDAGQEAKRRKPRVPGGSGCDSVHDRAEHPECRV